MLTVPDTIPAPTSPRHVGPLTPRYDALGLIGAGGLGQVLRARDHRLGVLVALKVIHAHLVADPDWTRRFDEEARLLATLTHPGIPPVHDLDALPDGRPFYSMALIEGERWAEHARGLGLRRRIELVRDIAQTVGWAHEQGVIHRDLSPNNILVERDGRARVIDWGLARRLERGQVPITPSERVGTLGFVAPELRDGAASPRADVYALGGLLAHGLARTERGEAGFADPDLQSLWISCRERSPDARPSNGLAVANALQAWLDGDTRRARALPASGSPSPASRPSSAAGVGGRYAALPEQATTLHWHGMRVPNDQDGVSWVQDPRARGEQFTYAFTVRDSGTTWYHPHISSPEQVERGLYGVVVAEDPDDPVVDLERVLVLDDVDLEPDGEIAPPNLDESLINSALGRYGNTLLINGQSVLGGPLTAEAAAGGVERWRLVNAANARTFTLGVDGADYRVIAEDGTQIDPPQSPQRVTLASGQRVGLEVLPGAEDVTLTVYIQPPEADEIPNPAFVAAEDRTRDPADPLDWPPPALPELVLPEAEIKLTLDMVEGEPGAAVTWTINRMAWMSCEDELGGDPIPVAQDTPTRLSIINNSEFEHPFHLHGQFMQVEAVDGVAPTYRGQRDTVLLGAGQTVELFTVFDNPGLWMAHCHIWSTSRAA